MNRLFQQVYDKVLFSLALLAVVGSGGWFWREQAGIRKLKREPTMPVVSGPAYVPAESRSPRAPAALWSKPRAQSRGGDWLYEIFTPPVITYNPVARTFSVMPPRPLPVPVAPEPGLELLVVNREPYRLQLVGYFGRPGDYLAAFTSSLLPETVLARPGHRFETLGLALKSLEVRKVAVDDGEPGPAGEIAAFAVLQEEDTGAEVVLDSRMRRLTETPRAVFKAPGATGRSRELHEGDVFADAAASYRIERIQLDPPEVVVVRTSPGVSAPEMRVLRPTDQVAGQEAPPKPLVPQAGSDVAHNEQEFPSP